MAGTLGDMKVRIADELARPDLASQTANAINDAISAYQDQRFFFNETRAITFPSVQGQEFYDQNDNAALGTLQSIDYVILYMSSPQPFYLDAELPAILELSSQNGTFQGPPSKYCQYGQQIRVYPVPSNSGWTFRIGAAIMVPAPITDIESNNKWMINAEMLIRSRAKYELAVHVLKDPDLARFMGGMTVDSTGNPTGGAVGSALKALKNQTTKITKVGKGRVFVEHF